MNRLVLPRLAVLLILVALVGRLYQLQLASNDDTDRYNETASARTMRYLPVRPQRGEIFASDGKTLLAESVPIYTVSIRSADLPSPTRQPHERALVFAQLSKLLGVTTTLTISPSFALDQDIVLRNDLTQGLGADVLDQAQQHSAIAPIMLPLSANQVTTAAALVARFPTLAAIQTSMAQPTPSPTTSTPTANASLRSTFVISTGASLHENADFQAAADQLFGTDTLNAATQQATYTWTSVAVPAAQNLVALQLSEAYSTTLQIENPIAKRVALQDIPGYETLPIKTDISRDIALVLQENSSSLPGVVVEQDYRRRYPYSSEIQSLSPVLGFIGSVTECDLVRQNTARSWVGSLLESIGHAEECGIIRKTINPGQLGVARYLKDDRIGKDGIESSYENELRGQLGWEGLLVDANGQPVRAPQIVQPAYDGNNLVMTIDLPFQRQVEQILRNWIDISEQRRLQSNGTFAYKLDYKPIRSGVAIVMEVHTGRILAMVSWPAYDNNVWNDPMRVNELSALLDPANQENRRLTPLLNHAIALQYPPGSTLKQFDAAIALQDGVITRDTRIHDSGKLLIANKFAPDVIDQYVNAASRAYGDINVEDALIHSSNVFFMSVIGGNKDQVVNLTDAQKNIPIGLGVDKFADGLDWFGLGKTTGVQLSGELPGRVPTPAWKQKTLLQAWTTGDLYNAAIGQGNLEATPLQLITASVAIANDGKLYRPQIVQAITDSQGNVVSEVQPELVNQVPIDPSVFAIVREGMRRSVTEGPNIAARDACSNLQIAGKTGTAEFGNLIEIPPVNGKARAPIRQSHSWFVGFAPYDDPQIEVLALVEGSGDMNDGSATITVPAVTQIMQAYFKVTPPNPLPKGCQTDIPSLPARIEVGVEPQQYVRPGPGR